jgi:hypothetical protein
MQLTDGRCRTVDGLPAGLYVGTGIHVGNKIERICYTEVQGSAQGIRKRKTKDAGFYTTLGARARSRGMPGASQLL